MIEGAGIPEAGDGDRRRITEDGCRRPETNTGDGYRRRIPNTGDGLPETDADDRRRKPDAGDGIPETEYRRRITGCRNFEGTKKRLRQTIPYFAH